MTVTHNDFLNAAKKMIAESAEIDCRNASSRAYYGAYHAALKMSQDLEVPKYSDVNGGVHEQLIDSLENCTHFTREIRRELKVIGYSLRQIKNFRHIADYHLAEPFDKSFAETSINQTNKIIEKSEALQQQQKTVFSC